MNRAVMLLMLVLPALGLARQPGESPRTAAVEFRMGSYLPDVDKTFPAGDCRDSGQCPYEAIFDNDDPLMVMFLADRHVFTAMGTLSVGLGAGYWNVEGDSLLDANTPSSDKTELTVVPLLLQLTYRFDRFEDTVPVVPVLRAGLDYYYWRVLDGEGDVTSFEPGDKAEGGTWGYHYSVGAHILLDYFAPGMAADFDRDAGVNSSYITIEFQTADITDFGSSDAFRLGSEVLFFGLMLDM